MLSLTAACGDEPNSPDGGTLRDSGVAVWDADVVMPIAPTAPAAPAPTMPMQWDCPDGWRSVALEGGAAECSPWPEGTDVPSACPVGEAHFPGTGGCAPVGAACPANGWPASLPSGRRVHYVRASAAGGGTGVRAAPYRRIADAVAAAANGDVIAVGIGTYDEVVFLEEGIALFGACPAETILTNSTVEDMPVILVAGVGPALAEVHDVSIRDTIDSGIFVDVGVSVLIEGVDISSVSDAGVVVLTASATVRRVSVRDVAPRTSDGAFGVCIAIEERSTATIDQFSGSECHTAGVLISASTATVTNTVVTNTRQNPTDMNNGTAYFATGGAVDRARGVEVGAVLALSGGDLTLRRGRFADVSGFALTAISGTLRAEDVVVHYPDEDVAGSAVGVRIDGVMELDRVEMRDATSVTMYVQGTGRYG
ncbi:MAG: right-handed parallel beta-helix repeat-containing protein [Deltaproteobacteria bacterium]|nr:right-handed parallel beta-helix repeat-containing protein [Deltaproteobacteria bacterium]